MYKRDNVLVRDLDAPEIMGQAEEIIVGKTGTITKAEMTVKKIFVEAKEISNSRKNTLLNTKLARYTVELIKESILFNTQARIETNETYYIPRGDATDTCMINFLQDAEIPVHLVVQRKFMGGRFMCQRGFKEGERTHITAVENFDDGSKVDIFVKGAPERVLEMCISEYVPDEEGNIAPADFEDGRTDEIMANLAQAASDNAWRMISYAHLQMDKEEFMGMVADGETGIISQDLFDNSITGNFVYLASFGLKDSLRPEVRSAVLYAKKQAQINVRLVSNDLKETAVQAALKSEILNANELDVEYAVMDGETFFNEVKGIVDFTIDGTEQTSFRTLTSMTKFEEIIQNLRVLYRATSLHKEALVVGLKSLRIMKIQEKIKDLADPVKQKQMIDNEASKIVATGEGVNDISALGEAQVGVAMNGGVASAKANAQLVLTDDNFKSCLQAVLWGRNIYQNVTRFLQFQITVNLSCILVVFIGIFFYSEMPMSSAQLLWINLIMDVIGAIALGTEPPMPSLVKGDPRHQTALLKQKQVWRQIIGVSIYNTLIILLLYIFGPNVVAIDEGIAWNGYAKIGLSQPDNCSAYPKVLLEGQGAAKACLEYRQSAAKGTLLTYVFNTFVFLQIFNMINSRKVGIDDKNVFESPTHNIFFLIAFFGMIIMQMVLVQYLYWVINATPLSSRSEWGAALTVGASVLLISFVLKLTPKSWVDSIPDIVDENDNTKNPFVA